MRIFTFLGIVTMTAAMALLTGCSKQVSQKDVNQHRAEATQAMADAEKKTQMVRRETVKDIAEIDQERNDAVSQEKSDLAGKPAAIVPNPEGVIDRTNRQADQKIAVIQEKSIEQQKEALQEANEKTEKAERTSVIYEAQKEQKAFVDARQIELAGYDRGIVELKTRGDSLTGDAKARFDQQMKALDDKRLEAIKALDNLKSAKPEVWTTFRDEVTKAFQSLKATHQEVKQPQGV